MLRTLPTPGDFDFLQAVCSHGFFMLPPNRWDPAAATLHTVVTLDDRQAVSVALRAPRAGLLRVASPADEGAWPVLQAAVRRMLRLDEDLRPFHRLCWGSPTHRAAARMRFGRLLRSPTLFEDMVKVICTCNVGWARTVDMVGRLVACWGVPATDGGRGFPTPRRLAEASPAEIAERARTGYRADYIHRLARQVADGRLDLRALEDGDLPSEVLMARLRQIRGIGPYAAAHLCMLLGRYDQLAVDSEMMRLLRTRFPRRRWTPARIRRHYAAWHPYPFLAFWFELWEDYVRRHGRPEHWSPADTGRDITRRPRPHGSARR